MAGLASAVSWGTETGWTKNNTHPLSKEPLCLWLPRATRGRLGGLRRLCCRPALLVAATMAARPAFESRRLGFAGAACFLAAAHLARCAAAIRARPAALILRTGLAVPLTARALRISAMRTWMPSTWSW